MTRDTFLLVRFRRTGFIVVLLFGFATAMLVAGRQSWLRAGTHGQIAFDGWFDGSQEIYVMDPDGSHLQRLTRAPSRDKYSQTPAWSPDRKKIVFVSNKDGSNDEIYTMNADGSDIRQLTKTPGNDKHNENPHWSPDGRSIVFDSDREFESSRQLYVMSSDGSQLRRLTEPVPGRYESWIPDWSPDGRILFVSDRDGVPEIYVMNVDGSNVRRLTHIPGKRNLHCPVWSPDGRRIVFQIYDDLNSQIHVMDANGSNVTQLTKNVTTYDLNRRPHWSPDGKRIAFQSERAGTRPEATRPGSGHDDIYVIDADGSHVRRLTFDHDSGHPNW